jgi:hypothetical protein
VLNKKGNTELQWTDVVAVAKDAKYSVKIVTNEEMK